MNTFSMYSPRLDETVATRPDQHSQGMNRLIAAAVVNHTFRELLLDSPETALEQGYFGQKFNLEAYEEALVTSIDADNLTEFAAQVVEEEYEEFGYERVSGSGRWVPAEPALVVMDSN